MKGMKMEALDELRLAREKVDNQKQLVLDEMDEKSKQGILWTNGQCKAWPDYEKALVELDEVWLKHST
jgi:hypothetical protein